MIAGDIRNLTQAAKHIHNRIVTGRKEADCLVWAEGKEIHYLSSHTRAVPPENALIGTYTRRHHTTPTVSDILDDIVAAFV